MIDYKDVSKYHLEAFGRATGQLVTKVLELKAANREIVELQSELKTAHERIAHLEALLSMGER